MAEGQEPVAVEMRSIWQLEHVQALYDWFSKGCNPSTQLNLNEIDCTMLWLIFLTDTYGVVLDMELIHTDWCTSRVLKFKLIMDLERIWGLWP